MKNKILRLALVVGSALLAVSTAPRADDIDVFMVRTGVTSTEKPNILFMLDNTPNWSRQAQQWPDNGGTQGAAELAAIRNVVNSQGSGTYMGIASYTQSGDGGYIRFGVRDMDVATNKNGLVRVLDHMRTNINDPTEKVNSGGSGYETSAMFEAYRYFKSLSVFRGAKDSGSDPAKNVDIAGNNGANGDSTAHRVGLTSGHAYNPASLQYTFSGTAFGCGTNALIMVVNNAQGSIPSGSQSYAASDGTTSAGTALSPIPGVSANSWTDEWARFLYQSGITVYILDAYNAQQNVSHSKTLERAAAVGGGKYYAVKNQIEIEKAVGKIIAEINAKDSTFASAALPVSASNRSQYLNQVFIGMFRPDPDAEPQWLGNLKRYKLGITNAGDVELQDSTSTNAINSQTGFVHECSVSEWTNDTGNFWTDVKGLAVGASACTAFPTVSGVTGGAWSDMPDGPTVAKGGVAAVIRRGNNPPTFGNWAATNRNILTFDSSASTKLAPLSTSLSGWTAAFLNWVTGRDDDTEVDGVQTLSEYITPSTTARVRPSVHGDVIHSKPLPVNYGGTTGVVVYYGANDGMFRAVNAQTGKERWAYVAPEHYSKFQRLKDQTPLVSFPGLTATPAAQKGYFFDGSTGLYQNLDNSAVWIYPSQRRGGRMLYGFNVTNPDAPSIGWRVGCPNLNDDTGCTAGFSAIGQTWSTPTVAMISGQATPVIVVGGGYDACEDADTRTPSCGSRKGNVIYILNALTGTPIKTFSGLNGSVAADIALADRNGDGYVDFAYAATTTGDVYRINFTNGAYTDLLPASWDIKRIGYSSGGGRKFQNTPAVMFSGTKMYVALGSGDREKPLISYYPYVTNVANRFYVLVDDIADPTAAVTPVNMDDVTQMQDFSSTTSCSTSGIGQSTTYKGWFMDLPGRGEQTVTSAVVVAGMVTFSTNRPYTGAANTCNVNANLGEARGYWLNILNASGAIGAGNATCGGDRSAAFVQGGLVPSPTVATVQIGNQVRTVALGAIQRSGGASSGIAPQAITPPIQAKRRMIFWRSNQAE